MARLGRGRAEVQHMDPVLLHQEKTKLQVSGCGSMTGRVSQGGAENSDLDEGAASPGHLPGTSLSPQGRSIPQPLWIPLQTLQDLRNEGRRLEQTAGHERHLSLDRALSHGSNSQNNRELQDDEECQRPQQIYKIICLEKFEMQRMTENTFCSTDLRN